jgi:hypothetical protein
MMSAALLPVIECGDRFLSVAPKISAAISRALALISCSVIFSLRGSVIARHTPGWFDTRIITLRGDFFEEVTNR